MCAITGIFDTQGTRPIDRELLERMNGVQRHRGPDGEGCHVEPGLGLAHRRLSIIDLEGGGQPQFDESGRIAVVFNGEIYNYRELRAELRARGHRFASESDTEVIVHGWEEWGDGCVGRLQGMFALALWDPSQERLLLARDRLGVKPLFYALLPDGLMIFASELKALLAHPGLPRSVDACAIEDYLAYGYIPDPRTILAGARKLEPGFTLSIVRGRPLPAPRRYWDLHFAPGPAANDAHLEHELLERVRCAVRARLVADVPLGAFLSGGVDSSAVVALMAEGAAGTVTTCSISFGDEAFDESPFAARVAGLYGTQHHVERVDDDGILAADALAAVYDEPFADSSAVPTYRVSEVARRHVTVALSGDGGDEALAGYRRYPWHLAHESYRAAVPPHLRPAALRLCGALAAAASRWPGVVPGATTAAALSGDATDGYVELISIARSHMRRRIRGQRLARDLQGYHAREAMRRHAVHAPADALSFVQYLDFKTYLPGDILTKVDRASMAHGLEVRSPFLDHQLLEWLATLPSALKLRNGTGKYLLKRALEPMLPPDILHRRKAGFAVPLAGWLRGPFRAQAWRAIEDEGLNDAGLFDRGALRTLMREHESSRRDHASLLWALVMLDASLRRLGHAGPGRRSW